VQHIALGACDGGSGSDPGHGPLASAALQSRDHLNQLASLLAFIFFTSVLSVVPNFISRRDLEQIDQQTCQLLESEARLHELSVRDPLTGLFNRRYLEETLERELRRAARKQLPLGIIMVDVDQFKPFNDTYGHVAGDALLRQVGDSLREEAKHLHVQPEG